MKIERQRVPNQDKVDGAPIPMKRHLSKKKTHKMLAKCERKKRKS